MHVITETEKEVYDEMMKKISDSVASGPVFLSDIVKKDMIDKGFDPINNDDITAYWMSKGIDTNG
jgi:CxxC motif-containing protein